MLKSHFLSGFTAVILIFGLHEQAEAEIITSGITTAGEQSSKSPTAERDDKLGNNQITSDSIVIDGDKLELHLDRGMHALGNASISRGKQTILGDEIDYDVQNDTLHVKGNVRIELGDALLTGPELRMRLSENVGEMHDAAISMVKENPRLIKNRALSGTQNLTSQVNESSANYSAAVDEDNSTRMPQQSRGDAKMIFFEGQDKKRLKDARYTTCAAGVDDWYIKAKELALNEFTEAGVGKNAYIEFKKIPILYAPWISFTYSGQRKSGLLAPSFGSTTNTGFELSAPYYWNIAPNMDATITVREMSKRGIQLQGEFRYIEENFFGKDALEYLPNDGQTGQTRYYTNLKHQHNFGNGWSAGYSLEKTSDNKYFSELSTRIITTSRILLPQQFNVNYANENWRFNALAQKFQTLDDKTYPYERLPQMTLNGNKYFGDANANLYSQLVAFDINKNSPSLSALPTGTRLTLYPSISLPMSKPYGYITPKLGIHYTNYALNNAANNLESQQRTLPIFSVDSGLYFDRAFKVGPRDYSQTLEPRIFYAYIPYKNQSSIPVFDTGESDLNFSTLFRENRFTGNDLVNDANQLSYALTSRLIETATGAQRLSASIGQRYYFNNLKVSLPPATLNQSNSSDIIVGLSANLKSSWRLDTYLQYNTQNSNVARTTVSSRFNPEPGKTLNLSYSYKPDLAGETLLTRTGINQFNASGQWSLGKGWYGVGRVNYSLKENQIIETLAGVEYNAGCWQTRSVIQRVSTATAQANYALFFQLELGGIASIGTNPLSIIKRSIPGYASSGLTPDAY